MFDLDEYLRKQNLWKGVNVYVWMKNDGVPLVPPDTDKEAALALKDSMRAKCDQEDETIRLACFKLDEEETVCTLYPPPDPEEMARIKRWGGPGGHAVGSCPTRLEEFVPEMKQCIDILYKQSNDVEYICGTDVAYVQHGYVRVSVQKLPDEETQIEGTYNRYKRNWKVWITNYSGCRGSEPKVKPVGTYWTLYSAIEASLNAFFKEQVSETLLSFI
jgi:hypothetical protein